MSQTGELAALEERRRLLVAESGQLRRRMTEDFAQVRASGVWVERGWALFRTGRVVWPLAAGAAGLLLARKRTGWFGTLRKLSSWWRLGRTASSLWQSVRAGFAAAQATQPDDPEESPSNESRL